MNVMIKGMEMPKNCLECMFRISYWKRALTPSGKIFTYGCMLNGKEINTLEKRCKDCPIVEIPTPHGRLIDADKLTKNMRNYYPSIDHLCYSQHVVTKRDIDNAPTVIEAEA